MALTYQDLLEVQDIDKDRMQFVLKAIRQHQQSDMYKTAEIADQYYRKQNTTIINYQKTLTTASGRTILDEWSPNHKVVSGFFSRFVRQQNQYLLSNGAMWGNDDTADKLGKKFDSQLQKLGKAALIGGVAFGFWNLDHLQVFKVTEFVPLFDEENGSLRSGIRFWQIDASKPLRATLYEEDGYTDYIWNTRENKDGEILHAKRSYKIVKRVNQAEGEEIIDTQNYPNFPIVPMWANEEHQSELVGIRDGIDAYDLIKNGFENDLDTAQIYWIVKGAGGMDSQDLVQFLDRLIKNKIASADGDQDIEAQTIQIPFEARERLLDRIERDLYRDYQALNTDEIKSGSVVTAQIKAAYEGMNSKADDYEYMVTDFIDNLMLIVGIDDEATFQRSMLINQSESITTLLQAAQYLPEEYVTRKILFILGDADQAEDILRQMDKEELDLSDLDVEEPQEEAAQEEVAEEQPEQEA